MIAIACDNTTLGDFSEYATLLFGNQKGRATAPEECGRSMLSSLSSTNKYDPSLVMMQVSNFFSWNRVSLFATNSYFASWILWQQSLLCLRLFISYQIFRKKEQHLCSTAAPIEFISLWILSNLSKTSLSEISLTLGKWVHMDNKAFGKALMLHPLPSIEKH